MQGKVTNNARIFAFYERQSKMKVLI